MASTEDRLTVLLRAAREQLSSRVQSWTEGTTSDSGNPLLDLFADLTERATSIASTLPGEARAELARVGARLVALDASDEAVDVKVDGTRWTAVPSLADAAPDAKVYALDPESGAVRFGDGVNGAAPPDGATVATTYRAGSGALGNVGVTLTSRWPFEDAAVRLSASRDGRMRLSPEFRRTPRTSLERVEFFGGRLLSASDLADEQHYVRTKLRRLHRAALEVGIVKGLQVSVSTNPQGGASVVVQPGAALDPSGELIVIDEPVTCAVPALPDALVVVLRYVEQPAGLIPVAAEDGIETVMRATRTAEGFAVSIEPAADPAAVVLARLVPGDLWTVE